MTNTDRLHRIALGDQEITGLEMGLRVKRARVAQIDGELVFRDDTNGDVVMYTDSKGNVVHVVTASEDTDDLTARVARGVVALSTRTARPVIQTIVRADGSASSRSPRLLGMLWTGDWDYADYSTWTEALQMKRVRIPA